MIVIIIALSLQDHLDGHLQCCLWSAEKGPWKGTVYIQYLQQFSHMAESTVGKMKNMEISELFRNTSWTQTMTYSTLIPTTCLVFVFSVEPWVETQGFATPRTQRECSRGSLWPMQESPQRPLGGSLVKIRMDMAMIDKRWFMVDV